MTFFVFSPVWGLLVQFYKNSLKTKQTNIKKLVKSSRLKDSFIHQAVRKLNSPPLSPLSLPLFPHAPLNFFSESAQYTEHRYRKNETPLPVRSRKFAFSCFLLWIYTRQLLTVCCLNDSSVH